MLTLHIMRANYQAAIYKRALEQFGGVPSPHGKGWQVKDGDIDIHWMTLPPAPDSIIEFVNCACKKNSMQARQV